MTNKTLIASALFALAASSAAHAALYETSFENNVGEQTIATPVTAGDTLVMTGMLTSGAGSVLNSMTFTAAPGASSISFDAVWRSGNAGDTLRLVGVDIDLLDSSDSIVASDTFVGTLAGFAHSSFSFAGLTGGSEYTLRLTGNNTNVGQYIVDAQVAAVPLPASLSMLIPALIGLGAIKLRRRDTV